MNTFMTIIGLVLLGAIVYVGFVTYSLFIDVDASNSCSLDSDCLLVQSSDACPVIVSINQDYSSAWARKLKYSNWLYEVSGVSAECPSIDLNKYETLCLENKCVTRERLSFD